MLISGGGRVLILRQSDWAFFGKPLDLNVQLNQEGGRGIQPHENEESGGEV